MGAARAFLSVASPRFWRRLTIIAFEDFGRSDIDLTSMVVAAASDRHWRRAVGGEWTVASFLLGRLLARPRDRFMDELGTLAEAIVSRPAIRTELNQLKVPVDLRDLINESVHLVATCAQPVPNRQFRSPVARSCDRALKEMHHRRLIDDDLLELCMQGRRTSGCLLPVLFPLMIDAQRTQGEVEAGDLPPSILIAGIPSWSLDGYTRLGRMALHELHAQHRCISRLWSTQLSLTNRIGALQSLVFDVEGGLASTYLTTPLLRELKRSSVGCLSGLSGIRRAEGLAMVREAVPALNAIRADLWHCARARETQQGSLFT